MLLAALVFGPLILAPVCFACGKKNEKLRFPLACGVALLVFAGCIAACLTAPSFSLDGFCGLGIHFTADGFRGLYALIAALMWLFTMLFSPEYFRHYQDKDRYILFNLLTLGSILGVFYSDDLYTTFIFFEIMSVSSYAFVAHEQTKGALRAADTYLAVAVIGGLVTLMGLFLCYHTFGTLSFEALRACTEDLAAFSAESGLALEALQTKVRVASWLVLFGFAAKAGMFPLHIWLPKAHPVAPAPASALLSGILTKSGVFGLIAVCVYLRPHAVSFGSVLLILACITMFLGAVLALLSVDLKRTLACSSMSQIGFITVGLSAMTLLGEEGGLAAGGALMHMVNHSLIKLCLFMCAGAIYMHTHTLNLNQLRGFGRKKPLLHAVFLIGALAISCVPPFGSGYLSKSLLHEGLLEYITQLQAHGEVWVPFKLAEILFLISGGLTFAYMLKLYLCLFIEKNADPKLQKKYDDMKNYVTPLSGGVLIASALILLCLAVLPDLVFAPLIRPALSFFKTELPQHIHWFSGENLIGAAKSLSIGLIVYLVIVRRLLAKKEKNSCITYIDRLPASLDLENGVYRPLLLQVLPSLIEPPLHLIDQLPEMLSRGLRILLLFLFRFFGELPENLVILLRRTILHKKEPHSTAPAGNRFTWALGCLLGRIRQLYALLPGRKPAPAPEETSWRLHEQQKQVHRYILRVRRSVSWGLILMAVGLLVTCLYLLLMR